MLTALLMFVVYVLVVGLVIWLLLYLIDQLPLPAPFGQVARVVVIAVGVIILIMMLLALVGDGSVRLPALR
jgi:hypothetical protein